MWHNASIYIFAHSQSNTWTGLTTNIYDLPYNHQGYNHLNPNHSDYNPVISIDVNNIWNEYMKNLDEVYIWSIYQNKTRSAIRLQKYKLKHYIT